MDNTLTEVRSIPQGRKHLRPLFALAFAMLCWLYWNTFAWWWTEWTYQGSFYAHAIFVPFFVAVMIYRNREKLEAIPWRTSWGGIALIAFAMALLFFGDRVGVAVVKSLSFVLFLIGSAFLTLGAARTKALLFPLAFLIMMIPLIPDQLINAIAFPIQIASTTVATHILNAIQLPATQRGTLIEMETYRMAVELPCSGFKTLLSLLTFAAAFAYLVEAAKWKRWLLFLTTIPLSLIINALRITFIGIVGDLISTNAATLFHDYSGFLVLLIAFFCLYTFSRLLKCSRFLGLPLNEEEEEKDVQQERARKENPETPLEPTLWQQIRAWRISEEGARRLITPLCAINVALGVAIGAERLIPALPPPSTPIGTRQVPKRFVSEGVTFKAEDGVFFDSLPKDIQEGLNPLQVINRDYKGTRGESLQLFITAGNGRKVFHDPHTCSIASNASLEDAGMVDIPTKYGTLRVLESHFRFVKSNDTYMAMFFYVIENKIVQRTEQVRNQLIWQMIKGDSGKPSYFIRVTQRYTGVSEKQRDDMKRFIAGLWNEIAPVLTGTEKGTPDPPEEEPKTDAAR